MRLGEQRLCGNANNSIVPPTAKSWAVLSEMGDNSIAQFFRFANGVFFIWTKIFFCDMMAIFARQYENFLPILWDNILVTRGGNYGLPWLASYR